jgi:antitoxin component of MazEF toxin-antitoxin module
MSDTAMSDTVMIVERSVVRNGRSRAITLPNVVADAMKLSLNDPVQIILQSDGTCVIIPMERVAMSGGGTFTRRRKMKVEKDEPSILMVPQGVSLRVRDKKVRSQLANVANRKQA